MQLKKLLFTDPRLKKSKSKKEMIGETQPKMELLEVVEFIYPFSLKTSSSIPSAARIWSFNTASLDFMCSSKFFFKQPCLKPRTSMRNCTMRRCGVFIQRASNSTIEFDSYRILFSNTRTLKSKRINTVENFYEFHSTHVLLFIV